MSVLSDEELSDLWDEIDNDSSRGMDNDQSIWLEEGYEEEPGVLSSAHSKRSRQIKAQQYN